MASTYYDSQLTAAKIESALEAIDGVITPANNGKVLRIKNGVISAESIDEIIDVDLDSKTITQNGTYYAYEDNLDGYNRVVANVPNTYTEEDELKVVYNGELIEQTGGHQFTENGWYDTSFKDSITVSVPQGENATAVAGDILSGKTAMVNGTVLTGTMTNNGAVSGVIDADHASYTVPAGYHNGSGTVDADIATTAEMKAYLGIM